jgi:hypothetical protein
VHKIKIGTQLPDHVVVPKAKIGLENNVLPVQVQDYGMKLANLAIVKPQTGTGMPV